MNRGEGKGNKKDNQKARTCVDEGPAGICLNRGLVSAGEGRTQDLKKLSNHSAARSNKPMWLPAGNM